MKKPLLTIEELLARYVMGKVNFQAIPNLAIEACEKGYGSESMYIVAGMNSYDNSFELMEYFDRALEELKANIRDKTLAAKLLVNYTVNEIIKGRCNCYGGVNIIINNNFSLSCPKESDKDEYYRALGVFKIYKVWLDLNKEIKTIDYKKNQNKSVQRFYI